MDLKKFLIIPMVIWAGCAFADLKITDLQEDTSPAPTDLLLTVKNPGSAPTNKKSTIANVLKNVDLSGYATTAQVNAKVSSSSLGAANGVATLGSDSKLTSSQLPASLIGALHYKGVLDASGGVYPSNPSSGDYYVISVAGTISAVAYYVGDWATYNGSSWDRINNSASSSGWTTAGSVVKLITASNKVGINNASPATALDVGGTVTATAFAGNASTATALATDPSACTSGQYVSDIAANGTLTCSQPQGNISGLTQNYVSKGLTATSIQNSLIYDNGSAIGIGTTSPTQLLDVNGTVKATAINATTITGTVVGSLTGNANTATALAANPIDCNNGQYATSIDAQGNLTCTTPAGSIAGLTINKLTKAASSGTISDSSIYDTGSAISTSETITAPTFIGALTGNSSTATALAANGSNCSAGQAARGVDASGAAENCFTPAGITTDDATKSYTSYNLGVKTTAPLAALDVEGSVYIGSSGKIGVGTTSPAGAIDVNGGAIYGGTLALSGAGQSYCGNTYTSNCVYVGANATKVRIDPNIYTTGTLDVMGVTTLSSTVGITGDLSVGSSPDTTYATAAGDALVKGAISADGGIYSLGSIYLNGAATAPHIRITQTTAPSAGTPASCGTGSPTATVTAGSTDTAGSVTINAGTGSPGGCTTVITFNRAYSSTPKAIIITSGNANAAGYKPYMYASSASTFTAAFGTAPGASSANIFYYLVIE